MANLTKEMVGKMQKYNKLRSQADDLQHEIESYLENEHGFCYRRIREKD